MQIPLLWNQYLWQNLKLTQNFFYFTIIGSFNAEGDGKSIIDGWNEEGSLRIKDVVNAVDITDCLSKLIASVQGSLNAQSYSRKTNHIKHLYRLSYRWID
jgi:hypothetical protein